MRIYVANNGLLERVHAYAFHLSADRIRLRMMGHNLFQNYENGRREMYIINDKVIRLNIDGLISLESNGETVLKIVGEPEYGWELIYEL